MKKILSIIIFTITCSLSSFGQNTSDPITMKKVFGGYQFKQNGTALSMNQLVNVMKSNAEAYKEIKSAQSANAFTTVLGMAGGFLIGWPIGTSIRGEKEPNWALAGIGAGLIAVAIPISSSVNKKAKKAVETYNGSLQTTSFYYKKELKLSISGNGLGLVLKF